MYTPEEKQWGMLSHVLPLVVSVLTGNGWIASLVIYFMYKDKSKFVAYHALQSLYFQGFILLLFVAAVILVCVGIGLILIPVVIVLDIVFPIMAGLKANEGELYELPVVGRLARNSVGI